MHRADSLGLDFETIEEEAPPKPSEKSALCIIESAPKLHRGLDEDRFRALMSTMLKIPYDLIDRLYFLYAREGLCSFAQFTRMMWVICRGAAANKFELWFQIFDSGSKNYLVSDDMQALIILLNELLPDDHQIASQDFPVMQSNSDRFTLAQFTDYFEAPPMSLPKSLMLKLLTLDIQFLHKAVENANASSNQIDDPWDWTKI